MDEEKPNPLTTHLLQLVQGRQQAEVAKLTLMTQITELLKLITERLAAVEARLNEINERMKG